MEQELISKKELLELTEISYGQLYRWKRERLLPEEWFIKRSSFTGQETVFPRVQILERIGAIKELKDDLSLEAIAELLSPQSGNAIAVEKLNDVLDVDAEYLDAVIEQLASGSEELSFSEVVFIGALGALVKESTLDSPIAVELARDSRELAQQWITESFACEVLAISQSPEDDSPTSWHLVLFKEGAPPAFSKQIKRSAKLPLEATSAAIKQKLSESNAWKEEGQS